MRSSGTTETGNAVNTSDPGNGMGCSASSHITSPCRDGQRWRHRFDPRSCANPSFGLALDCDGQVQTWPHRPACQSRDDAWINTHPARKCALADTLILQIIQKRTHAPFCCTSCNERSTDLLRNVHLSAINRRCIICK